MTPLDLEEVTLSGRNAIDASAGTGKTYAISRLYLRLVLESPLPGDEIVDRILVVTFTRPAAAELRQRIRETLVDARSILARRRSGEAVGADVPILRGIPAEELAGSIERLDQA
ncbi:MAG: UvrD-helicase domain-containing protein, partial [Alphaproteobacteria bacterium]